VLGDLASGRNLLVINDEAHHAWRVPPEGKVKGVSKAEVEEATKWIGGLDRIHRARGILSCYDFSATPFVPSGKKSSEEALFDWIVSDFGLNDAIESGLVKTPRVVVRDDALVTDKDLKSRLYHIYADPDVKSDLNRKADEHEPLPQLVTNAYYLLGKDWRETATAWRERGHRVPPALITVANRTETAARINSGDRLAFPPVLRLLSHLMPEDFPFHPHGKMDKCHIAHWALYPSIDHVVPVARGGGDEESNWVTTSMLRNMAKGQATLEELGWELGPPGCLEDWDGLMGFCPTCASTRRSWPSFDRWMLGANRPRRCSRRRNGREWTVDGYDAMANPDECGCVLRGQEENPTAWISGEAGSISRGVDLRQTRHSRDDPIGARRSYCRAPRSQDPPPAAAIPAPRRACAPSPSTACTQGSRTIADPPGTPPASPGSR